MHKIDPIPDMCIFLTLSFAMYLNVSVAWHTKTMWFIQLILSVGLFFLCAFLCSTDFGCSNMECMRTKIKLIGIPSLVLITLILVGILVIETKAWNRFQTWLNTNCVYTSNDVELANVEANVSATNVEANVESTLPANLEVEADRAANVEVEANVPACNEENIVLANVEDDVEVETNVPALNQEVNLEDIVPVFVPANVEANAEADVVRNVQVMVNNYFPKEEVEVKYFSNE